MKVRRLFVYLVQVIDLQNATNRDYYNKNPSLEVFELIHLWKRQLYGNGHSFHTHNLTTQETKVEEIYLIEREREMKELTVREPIKEQIPT